MTKLIRVFFFASTSLGAQQHEHAAQTTERLGSVHFGTSCSAAAQPQFDRAVTLVHSFEFAHALDAFGATLKADPSCAMAEWGIALSRWSNPMAAGNKPVRQLQLGRAALERAGAIGAKTGRERGYIGAVAKLYADYEHTAQAERVAAYRDAMGELAAKFPLDTEASIFYAISLTAASPPSDKTYAGQLRAAAILEPLFKAQPNHPGLAHYLIHTYDVPALAPRAIAAAQRYSTIAPDAPHALHMPSHTFTRVGEWQASIDANVAAAASARAAGATAEELHASDYRMYAYLQTGQDAAARRLLESLPEIASRLDVNAVGGAAPGSAGEFALAAMPARFALERGAWADAARLELRPSALAYTEAMTWYARAIGAAHTRDTATVRSAINALQQLRDRLAQANEVYWTEQVRIQAVGATALLALAQGRTNDAITEMRAAADAEDRTEKSAVTPGPLAPARELLGEMLLQANEPARALAEFEMTLTKEPNRLRSLRGAVQAAAAVRRGAEATSGPMQSEERAVIAVVTHFFDGMRTRDTTLMRSTVVPGAVLISAVGPAGLGAPNAIDAFIDRIGKGSGPGGDEQIKDPRVNIDGPLASLWAYFTYTRAGETRIDHCGVDSFLLRKGPDGWKIFHVADTHRTEGCTPIAR